MNIVSKNYHGQWVEVEAQGDNCRIDETIFGAEEAKVLVEEMEAVCSDLREFIKEVGNE